VEADVDERQRGKGGKFGCEPKTPRESVYFKALTSSAVQMLRAWGFGVFGLGLLTVGEVSMDWNR
jgi:hypothetical protein